MAGGSSDRRVVCAILFIVSVTPLVYIIGRRILRKQRRPTDCGSEEKEETVETKTMKDETETSTAAREQGSFNHEVFLSFRGADTRNRFTSLLHKELKTHGITAFIDSEDLRKGKKISDLITHIKGSKIFLPIFSKNYADSKWCLREITEMVEINKKEGKERPIIPVFYDVSTFDVKDPKGSFGKTLEKLQRDKGLSKERINEWRTALTEAGNISGFCLSETNGNEEKLITVISKEVSNMLCKVPFDIKPMGIRPSIDSLKQMLEKEEKGVCMIGICGLGGIGKTTLAMVLYDELFRVFESSCFLSDIRANENKDGLHSLQAKVISKVLEYDIPVANVEEGVNLIRQRFRSKKILLILDDVDHTRQLKAFIAEHGEKVKCFKAGSKIIVTTRDKNVLTSYGLQENDIYFPERLDVKHSIKLFCHHAFHRDQPSAAFGKLSQQVVEVAQGLPLALIVFGSLFWDLKEKQEWEEMLEKLKCDQNKEVHERLKVSYDSLDHGEKSVFLDIACFFIGWEKEYPVRMWKACGYFPTITLKVLQNKSLIKINEYDRFEMHDQIRDMGRTIVKEEGNSDPLKYSRPWTKDQMLEVLRDAKVPQGNPYIQGIDFNQASNEKLKISWSVIKEMPSLRMITGADERFHCFKDEEDTIRLPSNIRWLEWRECPYGMLTFHNNRHEQLCVLDLSKGYFRDFRSHRMEFPKLKVLDLSWCHCLIRSPDFTYLPSLEVLRFDNCGSLTGMDESIMKLHKLVQLSLSGCSELKGLPAGLCELFSLESLDLHKCLRISVLPTHIGDLMSLKYFGLSGTSISTLPDSIGSLQSLEELDISECSYLQKIPDSIGELNSLSRLSLHKCKLLEQLPNSIGMLTSLKGLNIDHCKSLREVPDSLGDLNIQISLKGCISLEKLPNTIRIAKFWLQFDGFKSLRRLPDSMGDGRIVHLLSLCNCESLKELPDSIGMMMVFLEELDLSGCTLLGTIPESIGNLESLKHLSLKHCQSLEELPKCIGRLLSLVELDLSGCTLLRRIPKSIGNLKILNRLRLNGCRSLEELPECISRLSTLTHLSLQDCPSLKELPKFTGKCLFMKKLDLSGCTSIKIMPESIGDLKRLKHLSLEDCRSLKELPKSMEGLESLKVLHICDGMSVEEVLDFIGKLTSLEKLYLWKIEEIPDSIGMLKSLQELHLSGCGQLSSQSFKKLLESMEGLKSLKMLHICGGMPIKKEPDFMYRIVMNREYLALSELDVIPEPVGRFSPMEVIVIEDCHKLESLPQLPSSLTSLGILGCAAFRNLSDPSTLNCLEALYLVECKAFTDSFGLGSLKALKELALIDQDGLSRDLMDKLSQASFEQLETLLIFGASDSACLRFGLPKSKTGPVQGLQGRCYMTEELPSDTSNINICIQVQVEGKIVTQVACAATRGGHLDDEGRDFYELNSKEGKEIVKWVEEGNTTLIVLTTYNHYRLRMASLRVSFEVSKGRPSAACYMDVFISFRGKDTRKGLIGHLYRALTGRGIATFIDSEHLKRGKKISDMIKHLERSTIFLPIFSKNYADSKWCLREITKMVEINKREGWKRPIIPVFYHVEPSDFNDATTSFGLALENHQHNKRLSKEQINEWRTALTEAGNISGFSLSDTQGNEAKLITLISKDVSNILCKVRHAT